MTPYANEIREYIESKSSFRLSQEFIETLYYKHPNTEFQWDIEEFGEMLQEMADVMDV